MGVINTLPPRLAKTVGSTRGTICSWIVMTESVPLGPKDSKVTEGLRWDDGRK